ncbi:MAG TPA: hypothetical protein VH306_10265 [Gaiellaceae bacterium]|jgi:hypothetical protein
MLERLRRRLSPSLLISLVALFVALGGVGYSATGGTFILGHANQGGGTSSLSSAAHGPTLKVSNTGHRTAAFFKTRFGIPPFAVSGGEKVQKLNADKIDGLTGSQLQQKCQKGSVLGYGWFLGNDGSYDLSTIPSTFVEAKGFTYNCTGGKIWVARQGAGRYLVSFDGLSTSNRQHIALANVDQSYGVPNLYANTGFALNAGKVSNQVVIKTTAGTPTDSVFMIYVFG